jgi:hypothetical protein
MVRTGTRPAANEAEDLGRRPDALQCPDVWERSEQMANSRTTADRRRALAHFVLQMSPHDTALLREALEQARPEPEAGGDR